MLIKSFNSKYLTTAKTNTELKFETLLFKATYSYRISLYPQKYIHLKKNR